MANPWRHPKTGIYWFRRGVPERLRARVGKREVKRSLGTRDVGEARHRHLKVAEEVERQWSALDTGPAEISLKTMMALVGEFYARRVGERQDEPGSAFDLQKQVETMQLRLRHAPHMIDGRHASAIPYQGIARQFLLEKGYVLEDHQFVRFINLVAQWDIKAREEILKNANGDYSPDPNASRFPPLPGSQKDKKVLLWPAWEKYSTSLSPASRKRWRGVMKRVQARFGDDLAKITFDGIVEWKDDRLKEVDALTVKDGDLAALRWLLQRLVKGGKLPKNAAVGVEVLAKKKPREREKGFTEDEAKRILAAALQPGSRLMSKENAAARRWVPWLCAYTGARVNEITQARQTDVRRDGRTGICYLRITPEAGSVKNAEFRDVPLHPHLIEQGFLDFVRLRGGKPLFYDPARARKRNDENPYYKKVGERLGEWVRSQVKITDARVQPNHGWRHRFKSVGRALMNADVLDLIQGHVPRREAQKYGDTWIEVAYAEIVKHPRYDVATGRRRSKRMQAPLHREIRKPVGATTFPAAVHARGGGRN